MHNAADI